MNTKQLAFDFDAVQEVYKFVEGFEGIYRVSDTGLVQNVKSGLFLRGDTDKDGYKVFSFTNKKLTKKIKGHRLVYHTFFPNTNKELQINHLNGIRNDNRLVNLEPVNNRENNTHKFYRKKTSSKYRGVTRAVRDNTWRAQIQINNKKRHIGQFNCETAAYFAYLKELKSQNLTNKYA